MTKHITVTEMLRNFSDYINRVSYRGENFILIRGKQSVAELRPAPLGCTAADIHDLFKSLPRLDRDDVAQFKKDLLTENLVSKNEKLSDPWE